MRCLVIAEKAFLNSSGAAHFVSLQPYLEQLGGLFHLPGRFRWFMELSGLKRTPIRCARGKISFSSSSRFALSSGLKMLDPVIFPPGRARLATKPNATGSPLVTMTIGIVVVAFLAARIAGDPAVSMTSTLRRTNSAANSGSRSNFPSAQRDSMTRFLPSSSPSHADPPARLPSGQRCWQRRLHSKILCEESLLVALGPRPRTKRRRKEG